jgi:hypothetical protein
VLFFYILGTNFFDGGNFRFHPFSFNFRVWSADNVIDQSNKKKRSKEKSNQRNVKKLKCRQTVQQKPYMFQKNSQDKSLNRLILNWNGCLTNIFFFYHNTFDIYLMYSFCNSLYIDLVYCFRTFLNIQFPYSCWQFSITNVSKSIEWSLKMIWNRICEKSFNRFVIRIGFHGTSRNSSIVLFNPLL